MEIVFSSFENVALWAVLGSALLGIIYALILVRQILAMPQGNEKMKRIAHSIQLGAGAYLKRQFRTIIFPAVLLMAALFFTADYQNHFDIAIARTVAFILGAGFSALVGFTGMGLAVRGNIRTAAAAEAGSFPSALKVAFRTGTIAGMLTVGLGLVGACIIFMWFKQDAEQVLLGFGLGGCLLALFMRVGGGIYTKAADVGADLVGKVEKSIPEDDARNAAVIADNVGDNVGDCAGMAADIFESYEVTLVAAMILGLSIGGEIGQKFVIFPLLVRGVGVLASIVGTYFVRLGKNETNAMSAINRGFWISTIISAGGFLFFALEYVKDIRVFWSTLVGLILAIVISSITEHFTSAERKPVREIAASTRTGSATTILSGFAVGLESSVWAIISIVAAIFASIIIYVGFGAADIMTNITYVLYGIALCGMGMLTTTGIIVSEDTFGPVVDNANGIAEMSGMGPESREVLTKLDAVGNTTKAITKGFAIATAVVAATSLFGSFCEKLIQAGVINAMIINIANPRIFIGMLVGGAVPFLFSSITIRAVGRAAGLVVEEVRRQFREIKGLWEGTADPDSAKCVDICTTSAIRELLGPGILAVCSPILVGFLFGAEALGGFLAGLILVGQLLAVMLANSGGAWDNAKKHIEDGHHGGKGSECHKASVVGDTVGDPFKDTAGPAINPLIKVINMIAILLAPVVAGNLLISPDGIFNPYIMIVIIVCLGLIGYSVWSSKRGGFSYESKENLPDVDKK